MPTATVSADMVATLRGIVDGRFRANPEQIRKARMLLESLDRPAFGAGILPPEPTPAPAPGPLPVTFPWIKGGNVKIRVCIPEAHAIGRGCDSEYVFKITRKDPEPTRTERGESTATNSIYFVSLVYPNGWSDYLGVFEPVLADVGKGLRITRASRYREDHAVCKLFSYVMRQLSKRLPLLDGYSVDRA